jgi:FkbM family methyltransferase
MSFLINFLAAYNRSGLRGSYRLTNFLAHRLKSLQNLPIQTENGILYADLRISSSRGILANPKSLTGEDLIMKRFVKKGDIVFDIGAHLGFYTLLLSKLVGETGKVFAFEPNSELLPSLKQTLAALSNVELFQIALSDKKGKINLFVPDDASMASLSNWTDGNGGDVHTVICEMERMDDLIEMGKLLVPQFIKCDVEGAELSVFSGALKTLNRTDAPIIMFELNERAARSFGTTVKEYFELLESLDKPKYDFFEVLPNGLKILRSREIEYTNVIAIPKAKS